MAISGKDFRLSQVDPGYTGNIPGKKEAAEILSRDIRRLRDLQELFYINNTYSLLIIFQAMDAAGKDSTIKHVMSGVNPQGCRVFSFKHPSAQELGRHFLWRHALVLPEKGMFGIFNRSHYENVLICKVHPELVLAEKLPGIDEVAGIDDAFWLNRYNQIARFERGLHETGTLVIKFFLHISRAEQKERLMERLENPAKHWKFSMSDIEERRHWDAYQDAYQEAIRHTSASMCPWYVIPADHKWYARLAVCNIIVRTLEDLQLSIPRISEAQEANLKKIRKAFEREG
jgi:PPK2 family polyphosphate:nucleotide phosphotransferase